MKYKLCNVCGKELKRPHPGCNAKAERARREKKVPAAIRAVEVREVEVATSAEITRRVRESRDRAMLPADPMSEGIANMSQAARDAVLRRVVTQRERQR